MRSKNILEQIDKAAVQFLSPLTSEETHEHIVLEAINLVKAKYGSLILKQEDKLVRIFSTLPHADRIAIRNDGLTALALKSKKAFVRHSEETNSFHPDVRKMGVKSNIYIPLINQGQGIGVLIVNSPKEEQFSEKELEILQVFGTFATLAIRKSQLYSELSQALEQRDLFISMAAHEFRTPLTTIVGYVQLLRSKIPVSDEPVSRWIYQLSWEASRLTQLVNELLQVNRITTGQLNYVFKENSLVSIMQRVLSNFELTRPNREIIFVNKLENQDDIVISDFDKLIQAFTNIVENALKYSSQDTPVKITLQAKINQFIIEIQDQGRGIPSKDLKRIFESFYRGEQSSHEGMGIGLYLVKNIIRSHHGSIDVRSKVKKGSKFIIKLPRPGYE